MVLYYQRCKIIGVFVLMLLFAAHAVRAEEPTTVRGRVTDEAGKPLAGVKWWISGIEEWRDGSWELVFRMGVARIQTTDEDGRFEVTFREKVRYDLQFDKWGYGPAFLYQVSAQSPEIHVVMRKGLPVRGTVTRLGTNEPCVDATVVELRLPNRRGVWYKKSTLVHHDGKFQFFACPPPQPPKWFGCERPTKWQLVCAGEVVEIDVVKAKPVDEIHFQIEVKVNRRPAQQPD